MTSATVRLTTREQLAWKKVKGTSNVIRSYHCPKGEKCYRMLDHTVKPIMNIKQRTMQKLIDMGRVHRNKDGLFCYNPKWHGNNKPQSNI